MMKLSCYRDGQLMERLTAERLDVCVASLNIYGVKTGSDPVHRNYFYMGSVNFQMVRDTLRIDVYEPDENGGPEHHIRLVAYDW